MPIGGNIAEAVTSKEIEERIKSEFADFSLIPDGQDNNEEGIGRNSVSKEFGWVNIQRLYHIRVPYRRGGYGSDHKPSHGMKIV